MADELAYDRVESTSNGVVFVPDGDRLRARPAKFVQVKYQRNKKPGPTEEDVRLEGGRRMQQLYSAYTPEERETWPLQLKEAEAYTLSILAKTPFIDALAAQRLETVPDMVALILAKAAAHKVAVGAILTAQSAILQMPEIPSDFTDDIYWP